MIKFKFDKDKAAEIMIYIKSKVPQCDKQTLMKICFFADMNHLENYGRPLTGNRYVKMNYGPVPSEIYDMLRNPLQDEQYIVVNGYSLATNREANLKKLSKSDVNSIDYAVDMLADMDFKKRTDVSHGHAWHSADLNKVIDFEAMLEEIGDIELLQYVHSSNAA
jgi:uncharacterized phage-associated protein